LNKRLFTGVAYAAILSKLILWFKSRSNRPTFFNLAKIAASGRLGRIAFASGERRRSEGAAVWLEDLNDEEPVETKAGEPVSVPCLTIRVGRTKTTSVDINEMC
jgi:hypothetical protein